MSIRHIRIHDDVAYVPLTRGYEAIIDAIDIPAVAGWNWHALVQPSVIYAARSISTPKRGLIYLHRAIMNAPSGMQVDHISGDSLDNRRENLRLATHAQNQRNKGLSVANKSGFKGVSWSNLIQKWVAYISSHGRERYLGAFTTPEAAHAAYCAASHQLHGEFGRTE